MSNSLAIAAVTATLQKMLNDADRGITANLPDDIASSLSLSSVSVTTSPPDKARSQNDNSNQVNIYLYQTVPNAALRNMDMPRQVHPGETAQPPVALTLHYLLTAYGKDNNDTAAHILLGQTMRIFHDNAVLDQRAIKEALAGNDLHEQVERVRLTPHSLSLEDTSKLWTAFQTQHRISAAYQVDVVLIESTRRARTPLPVLARGQDDSGVRAQADLVPPFPTITGVSPDIQPPGSQPSALLGNDLFINGHHLDVADLAVEVRHTRLPAPVLLPTPASATATGIKVNLPNEPENFPAGLYTLVVGSKPPTETFQSKTNGMPFAVAPKIEPNPAISVVRNGELVTVVLTCSPAVLPNQQVALLLGGDEVRAEPHPAPANELTFVAKDTPAGKFAPGKYFVRLRVDGVDSQLVKYQGTPPKPLFDPDQRVEIP